MGQLLWGSLVISWFLKKKSLTNLPRLSLVYNKDLNAPANLRLL